MIQSRDLVMVALGSRGEPERWFGPPLEDGIHLRWTFRSEMGYPFSGFQLYRRPHVAGTPVDVPLTGEQGGVIALPAVARRVAAEFDIPFWLRLFSPRQPLPSIAGLYEGFESATSTASLAHTRATVSLQSDAITAIRITRPGRWRLRRLRYVPVSQDQHAGWIAVRPICLPVTDPKYPCHSGPVNPSADREEAKSRLAAEDGQPVPEVAARYLDPADWEEFHKQVRALFDPPIPASLALLPAIEGEEPSVGTSTVDLTLLASVDPYFARILGLYWIDRAAQLDQPYDYKLVGRWLKSQLKAPETTLDFEGDKIGRRHMQTFLREGVIVRSFHRGSVEVAPGTPWKDTRLALDLKPFTPAGALNSPAYLRMQFQEPIAEAQLYLRIHQGEPQLATSISNVTVSKWKSPAGDFMILTVAATKETERIEFVALNPIAGSDRLHLSLCKVGILREWSAPLSEERAWMTYNVRSAPPAAMSAPTGLFVEPLQAAARELPNGIVAAALQAGIRWHVPAATVLLPREPVRYLIERQALGAGNEPAAIVPSAWKAVNVDAPVGIPDEEDGAAHFYFDDPSLETSDRFYAYRVAGIDIFGRVSPRSAPFVVDLSDRQAPPPPTDVEAVYLESDGSLNVRWNWSPGQRVQAPDAREFRIYVQRGRLNTMTGRIKAVAANTDATFTVTTDGTLESGAADAFAGEWLLNAGVYFTVLHNTTGQDFQLTVRVPSVPPPARPALGPYTLSIRPPRPLEGAVTKARAHLFGEVALKTDQVTDLGVNALAGKWLRQGGRDFRILANTSGGNLQLTVSGRGKPARAPGKGKFTVMEQDRTTRLLADPGNALHRDYTRPEQWAERVQVVEPLSEPIAGFITGITAGPASGTSTVTTNQLLNDPQHRFARGMLSNNGQLFRVISHSEGPPLVLTVANIIEAEAVTVVPVTGPFEYHMGYEVTIPFVLTNSPGEGVGYAQVAVSTADDKDHVPDAPRWNGTPLGDRPGNEGTVSTPVLVQTPLRATADERPDAPDVGEGGATAADYYGRSFIDVVWQHQDGMRVEVYRALDEAIFAADRVARPGRPTDRSDYSSLSDTQFESLVLHQPAYQDLSDEQLKIVAALPGNDAAFGLLTAEPLETDSYRATIDGKATNRHCFAIRFLDAGGNRGPLSWPSHAVRAPRTLAPRAPVITKVLGGDRKITLYWASHREPDLKEYRIYRADSEEATSDPRFMRVVHAELASADPATRPARIEWTDNSVRPRVTYRYYVVAVDHFGNESLRGNVVAAQPYDQKPPEPPEWVAAAWNASGGIDLTWTASDPNLHTVVLRHHLAAWMTVSPWLPPGVTSFTDFPAPDAMDHRYRLRVQNEAGNLNIAYHEILVSAP